MWERLKFSLGQIGCAFSQLVNTLARTPRYVAIGDTKPPDANLTHSAWVGQAAIDGFEWALETEREIDSVFGAGHCRRAAERRE